MAIDLTRTRLHYVLGFEEPYNPQGPKRKGAIPDSDKIPGILLATFNGGFKAIHGHFGAMSDGIVALPPRNGLATIAIYNNGQVQMGVWGEDLADSPDLAAYRQNGPPVVYKGEINPQIQSNDPMEWGYTVDKVAPTWRSGVGLSRDGNILYYFCGSSLSMEALSTAMLHTGAYTAIQLDINGYWVMFVATIPDGDSFILKPLFPLQMTEFIDRYMHPYGRDFFYLTTK